MTIEADIEKLLTYGQMALEQGWYDQAREHFEQALALDASNREAMKGLARVNEILSRWKPTPVEPIRAEPVEPPRKVSLEPTKPEVTPTKPPSSGRSIIGWIRKEREARADKVAERNRLAAEKREEQARETGKLHHLKVKWVCPRCKNQSGHIVHTAVFQFQCPACNRTYEAVIGYVVGFWVTSIPSWLPFTPWDWACTLRIQDLDGVQRNVRFIVSIGGFTPQSGDLVLISYKRQKPKLIQNYTAGEYCSVQNR